MLNKKIQLELISAVEDNLALAFQKPGHSSNASCKTKIKKYN
jgi:hypothetical protein